MSNPFYGLTPVYLPFSGTTDANGNFTTTLRPRAGFWCTGKIVGKVGGGFPAWEINDGAIPLGNGRGQRPEIAGLVAPPTAQLVVNVIGASPSTSVTGSFQGLQGPDMQSIAHAVSFHPNTISAEVGAPRIQLPGSPFTIAVGAQGTLTVVLPANATAVRVVLGGGGSFTTTLFQVIGQTTLVDYARSLAVGGGIPSFTGNSAVVTIPVDPEDDSSVQIVITNSGASANSIVAYVSAILSAEATEIVTNPGLPISADVTSRNGRILGNLGTAPPLWQAPNKVPTGGQSLALANNGTATLVAAVVGQTVFLFDVSIVSSVANFQLQDTTGLVNLGQAAFVDRRQVPFAFGGAPLAVSTGLQLQNVSGGASDFFWSVAYSQG